MGRSASGIEIYYKDLLSVRAVVKLNNSYFKSPESTVDAYYDLDANQLLISRNVKERRWGKLINVFLNSCLPDSSGVSVPQLVLALSQLLSMSFDEAAEFQTEAGIRELTPDYRYKFEGIESPSIDSIESEHYDEGTDIEKHTKQVDSIQMDEQIPMNAQSLTQSNSNTNSNSSSDVTGYRNSKHDSGFLQNENISVTKLTSIFNQDTRANNKTRIDRQLLSYVKKSSGSSSPTENGSDKHKANLEIERVAREAVCEYERRRGRIPEEMPQTHPGYDIKSVDYRSGEERYIEVKGTAGRWGEMGVGISKNQHKLAEEKGDSFWLYVVDQVNSEHKVKVYPIQNPTNQISYYMFDKNWIQTVVFEDENPSAFCSQGAVINHETLGKGIILATKQVGSDLVLSVKFDHLTGVTDNLRFNRYEMEVLLEVKN